MCGERTDDLLRVARILLSEPEVRRTAAGFIGYGATKPGDRVLLAVDNHYESEVVDALVTALRDEGAHVDVIVVDVGPDREFDEVTEIETVMRNRPWAEAPRRWEGIPWVEDLAIRQGYDLLIHGKGGGIPQTPHRYEAMPWLTRAHFLSPATYFPRDLHVLINRKTWATIWEKGRGGTVRVEDPEGTSLTWTVHDGYYSERWGFSETPFWGHLLSHPTPPFLEEEDASGVVAGTMSHFSRPFPRIQVFLEGGRITRIEGGNQYGAEWRRFVDLTKDTLYPGCPRPGLFWLWEVAIGTNPKITRPPNIHRLSSGGFEWERRRSGVIHVGIGSRWRGPAEEWAATQKIWYGHLHVHLLFPTMTITTREGEKVTVIDHGRLSALDDPEVRELARKYGDPDEILKEDWIPAIPGISAPGSYEDYARDPAPVIYRQ